MKPLNIDIDSSRFKAMIGVGGIGSGSFFKLNGNHTLGREESRSGYFLNQKDYCKLHIISHYVQTLAGPTFNVIPVGKVGKDDVGQSLLSEMKETGLTMNYVNYSSTNHTLFSFCLIYPDGSGGNLTTSDSACSQVDPVFVSKAEATFASFSGQGIALAVPEVTLEARKKLLELGSSHQFFRIASFTTEEMEFVVKSDLLPLVDLLAINLDEAASLTDKMMGQHTQSTIIDSVIETCKRINPDMILSITNGKEGSWLWDVESLTHIPSVDVKVTNTAGAGDAHLSGLILGLIAGLSLKESQQLAALTSSLSVTSPNTINKDIDRASLQKLAAKTEKIYSSKVCQLMEDQG